MKKSFVVGSVLVALLLVFSGSAWAVNQNNCGCGLGSIVFQGQDGLISQTFAVTTNGTSGNQTFGITSGTSNCDRPKSFASIEQINTFVAGNMDNLARDIARGSGEYINTLAVLMDVPEAERASFRTGLQIHFSEIYTSDKVSHLEVVQNIMNVASII